MEAAPVSDLRQQRKLRSVEKIADLAVKLESRPYLDHDYELAHKWWTFHNGWHLEKYLLSPLGVVITQGDKELAMGWIYFSNAALSQLGWVVSNPEIGPKTRTAALMRLYIVAEEVIKGRGYKAIAMNSDSSSLTKVGEMLGWKKMKPHDFMLRSIVEDDGDV